MKPTIKLDKAEIKEKIEHGDRYTGGYVLAVAPDGSRYQIHWMEINRQWDPWPDGWLIIGIPAQFPEGSGEEYELAEICLKDQGLDPDAVEEEIEESREYAGLVDYADAKFPEGMEAARENVTDFLLDAFLAACNGHGEELNEPAPWGYIYDEYGEGPTDEIEPPAEFEWA